MNTVAATMNTIAGNNEHGHRQQWTRLTGNNEHGQATTNMVNRQQWTR